MQICNPQPYVLIFQFLQLLHAMPVVLDMLTAAGIAQTVRTQLADHPVKSIRAAVGTPLLYSNPLSKGQAVTSHAVKPTAWRKFASLGFTGFRV